MSIDIFLDQIENTYDPQGLKLINRFFLVFARFEGSLKHSGFVIDGSHVQPNWNSFEKEIKDKFDSTTNEELKIAVDYLLDNPPRIQIIKVSKLAWKDRKWPKGTPAINILGQCLRDIRNNLFHGSKFEGNFEPDLSRNYILINSALVVINAWLEMLPSVKAKFLSPLN